MTAATNYAECSARERLARLLDAGSFHEWLPPAERLTSPHLAQLGVPSAFDDGVAIGRATLGGRGVFVAAQEGEFMGGGVGEVHGAKLVGLLRRALRDRPDAVLLLAESGGVRLHEANAGIFNPQNYRDRNNNPLAPVSGISNEIGVKGDWAQHGVSASFAVFEVKQDNYGVRDSGVPAGTLPDGSSAYVGVSGTRSIGWELDTAARLAAGWRATAGITRVRTQRNAADLTYANLPEWIAKLGTQYRFTGALQPLEIGGQLLWQGRMDAFNVPSPSGPATVTQSPFGLLNLNASWRFSDKTTVQLAVFNALDKRYWATLDYPNYGDKRFASVTLRSRF